jgi:S-adenosylmethionine-diacylglycerol 3-amino-3-carboxypropyl transferase
MIRFAGVTSAQGAGKGTNVTGIDGQASGAVAARAGKRSALRQAVHRSDPLSTNGILERMFTWAFKGLVYPQIWEDPEIDLEALEVGADHHVVAIASGGCNILSYLTANPRSITAVDLNEAHIALNRLKLVAAQRLPNHDSFYRFFGKADEAANVAAYKRFLRDHLDPDTRRYWERRDLTGRRRYTLFARDLYQHGLLGYFIGAGHFVARAYGIDPKDMLRARSVEEQRTYFDTALAPLFDKRMVRWATSRRMSLYGLGIPPAQYEALASSGGGDMARVLRERLERLACGFPLNENYFAWQAFGRSYSAEESGPLPPYLRREHFETIRDRAERVNVIHQSFTDYLAGQREGSVDRFILLDAQDWMTDAQLNALWAQITRTAAPGARVIFRTAAEPSLLPGRVSTEILRRWTYDAERSLELGLRDRSSIYGGFHIYTVKAVA